MVTARASGKAILLGEHAVVYGYPAVAVALRDVTLTVHVEDNPAHPAPAPRTWNDAWHVEVCGEVSPLPFAQRARLTEAFERAARLVDPAGALSAITPRPVKLRSDIPLGAGMGGSAAVSTALVRLVASWTGRSLDARTTAHLANEVDCLFHGTASGLDAAAVAADGGIILFTRAEGPRPLACPREFWLALVDTGTRALTSDMVALVARAALDPTTGARGRLEHLGALSRAGGEALVRGDLVTLGKALDDAHETLGVIGVSTPSLDDTVVGLRKAGALGAKLTGAGGGGLTLGLFDHPPTHLESSDHPVHSVRLDLPGRLYLTRVGGQP